MSPEKVDGFPRPPGLAYSPYGHSLRQREASPIGDTRRVVG
ncbi:hypothetical protein [Scytonema sp. NUACC21]